MGVPYSDFDVDPDLGVPFSVFSLTGDEPGDEPIGGGGDDGSTPVTGGDYPDTIEVFPATYSTDDDAAPVQTDGAGVSMPARVEWLTFRDQPLISYDPQGVQKATIYTGSDPGVLHPDRIIHFTANAGGVLAPPVVFRSTDGRTPPSGGKGDTEWAVKVERRT